MLVVNEGDKVMVENPSYLGLLQAFSSYGADFDQTKLDDDGLNIEELKKTIKEHKPKVSYLIPNFQNPTGITYTKENRENVFEVIKDEEMYQFFEDIDITVVPYIEASQSGVVMASYTFGKPVIVTDVGGLAAQVTSETGYVIPPNNPEALANKIKEMYETPRKMIEMGDSAYAKTEAIIV